MRLRARERQWRYLARNDSDSLNCGCGRQESQSEMYLFDYFVQSNLKHDEFGSGNSDQSGR